MKILVFSKECKIAKIIKEAKLKFGYPQVYHFIMINVLPKPQEKCWKF